MPSINFFSHQIVAPLKERRRLKAFITTIFRNNKKKLDALTYIFCDDEYLLSINRQFLNHDYYTDIITFDLSSSAEVVGEIYISIDRVRENARQAGYTLNQELHRVIFHGALHLCGYKDKSSLQKKEMTRQEDYYLEKYL